EALRPAKDHLVARLAGINDRDAAALLARTKLFVARTRLPPPAADEYYHADLIGLAAVGLDGKEIGTGGAIHDFGAGDILELRPAAGSATILLPFTEACVPKVDVASGRITVVLPTETTEPR